jgi:hypothetical protein
MRTCLTLLAATLAVALCLPLSAGAVVPPKDCGMKTIKDKRYQIKADQISCKKGRRYAKRKLTGRGAPRGYECRRPTEGSALKVYCSKGKKVFFAIRR